VYTGPPACGRLKTDSRRADALTQEGYNVQKLYYNAESLDRGLREFEREYGMSTEDFYARYMAGEDLRVPRFNQHTWAAFRDAIERMSDGAGVERGPVVERVGQALTFA
jgi:hypothetical protein